MDQIGFPWRLDGLTVRALVASILVLSASSLMAGAGAGSVHGWGNYNTTGRPIGLADAISIKAAANYTYVLRNDHTIALWGSDANGQLDAPPGLSNVVAIAAGYYMGMALTDDGKVHVWGAWGHVDQSAILNPPASVTNVVAIAGGMSHCLALRSDGTVVAWGSDLFGEIDVPPGLSNVVQIAAGQDDSLAITSTGQAVVWGRGGPVPSEATNLVAVTISFFGYALALRADGIVVAWGDNSYGQAAVPPGLSNVVAIAAGDQHSLALKSDGSLTAWGANASGQGVVPTGFVKAKAIAAGSQFNVVISDAPLVEDVSPDQSVAAGSDLALSAVVTGSVPWGSVWLKDGAPLAQTNFTLNLHDLQAPDAGLYSFIASNAFGSTSSRGVNVYVNPTAPRWNQQPQNQAVLPGQTAIFFADASGTEPLYFQWAHNGVVIPGATNATLRISPVSAADEGTYTVQVSNQYGSISNTPCYLAATLPRLLRGPTDMRVRTNWSITLDVAVLSSLPVNYRWFKDGLEIAGTTGSILAFPSVLGSDAGEYVVEVSNRNGFVRSDPAHITVLPNLSTPSEPGVVVEWGNVPNSLPSALNQETNVVGLAVGDWHTLILRQDGSVRVWANPQDLSLAGIPPEATNVAGVFAGPSYCLALRNDGQVVGWGGNSSGFGLSLATPGNSNVVSAAAGPSSCLLLKADGSVTALPASVYVPPNVTNIIAVSLTSEYAVALQANGKVLTWAYWTTSLGPEVPGLDKVVAIAGGESWSSVALCSDGMVAEWGSFPPTGWIGGGGLTNAVAVAGGRGFMALLDTGEVRTWDTQYGNPPSPAGLNANQIAFRLLHEAALTPAPFFDTHPQPQTFYAGGNGTLTTAVRSATPMVLQWYLEGVPIPGATNILLQFVSARPSQSGHYKLVARNAKYTTESQSALVSVEGPAEFLQDSGDQRLRAGQALQLQVQYVANPPGSAQWRFNGLPIPNATNSILFLPDTQQWMSGTYSLTVSNAYGVVSSPVMEVLVSPAAPTIVTQPSVPGQVPDGTSLSLQVGASGSEPLAYQWFFNDTPLTGQTQPLLLLNSIYLADDGVYRVTVTNMLGGTTSLPVRVTTVRAAPSPQVLPSNLLVREGKGFQLQATAGGTAGATYQWRFNGQDIAGETNALLSIRAAALSNSGPYSVTAANAFGTNEGTVTTIRVLRNPGAGLIKAWGLIKGNPDTLLVESVAAGNRHALALLQDGTVQGWGDNSYLQSSVPAGLSNSVAIAAGQDFSLALRADGTVLGWGRNDSKQASPPANLSDVVAISGGMNHGLALKADGSLVGWGNTNYIRIPTNLPPIISIAAGAGYSLALSSNGTVWAWGAPNLRALTNVPASLSNVVALAAGAATAYALDNSGLVTAWPSGPARPPDATNLTALASGAGHAVALRADAKVFAWGSDTYGQVTGPRGVSNILAVAAGDQTTLAISGEPKILSAPLSRVVKGASSVALSVNAVGTAPLAFQWYLNGQALVGKTDANLGINFFDATNAGTYSIEVKNAFATARTNAATLTLGLAPTITSQPADQSVTVGSNAVFAVQCSGTPALTYQWALNGTNLLGATSSSLSLSNLLFSDQGSVSVQIANAFGTATSRPAALLVLPPLVPPGRISMTISGGALGLHLTLQPNRTYSLLSSTNLVDWVSLQTVNTPGTGVDLSVPLAPDRARFYRLMDLTH